jgi:hypothetical protein
MARTAKKSTTSKQKTKRASAKAATKKAAAKTTVKNISVQKSVTLQKLYKFNLFSAAASLVFAVLSVIFVSKQSVDAIWSYATKDELASTSGAVLGPAYKTLATIEIRYLLAVIFVLSAVFSLLLATKLRNAYETGVKGSAPLVRWIFMGITLALTLEVVSILGGVQDIFTLKLIAGLVLVTTILAWVSEKENKGSKKRYTAFALSVFTGTIAWLPLVGSLIGTAVYGIASFGWHIYALSALVLFGFIIIATAQYRHVRDGISAGGYLQLEGKYLSTDFLIKLAVFAVILLALYK